MTYTNGTTINAMQTREETRYDMNDHKTDTAKTGEVKEYALCPFSGIGKPPTEWSHCVGGCSVYDATTGFCALNALWSLRQLPFASQYLDHIAAKVEKERGYGIAGRTDRPGRWQDVDTAALLDDLYGSGTIDDDLIEQYRR